MLRPVSAVMRMGFLVGALSCPPPRVPVARQPLEIGPTGVVLSLPGGLNAPGPRYEVTIELPSGYALAPHSLSELRGPHGESVVVRAIVVDAAGVRWDFGGPGYRLGGGLALLFAIDADSLAGRRADRIELSANVPFTAQRILWWSGDPGSRCFSCM